MLSLKGFLGYYLITAMKQRINRIIIMKSLSLKRGVYFLTVLIFFSLSAQAGGNGNGNEPRDKRNMEIGFLCKLIPLTCGATTDGGNGNGNEPD